MADKKISQLANVTTPLAGTETLPVVQSSTTKKVTVANLTVGRTVTSKEFVSDDGTNGRWTIAQESGGNRLFSTTPSFGGWRSGAIQANGTGVNMTWGSDGNTTVGVGNLIIGTAGKGIDFSANTNAAGMTSELLNDYEEGTWTPFWVLGSVQNIVYTSRSGTYTKIGNIVHLEGTMKINKASSTVTTPYADIRIGGLPFNPATTCSFNYGVNYGEQNPLIACPIITGAIAGGSEVFLTKAQGENTTAWAGYSDFDFTVSTQIQFRMTYSV